MNNFKFYRGPPASPKFYCIAWWGAKTSESNHLIDSRTRSLLAWYQAWAHTTGYSRKLQGIFSQKRFWNYHFRWRITSKLKYGNTSFIFKIACPSLRFFQRGGPLFKMGSADLPEFVARRQVLVFVQHHAATFLPPNQLTEKNFLRHAISHSNSSSVKLIYTWKVCINTKAKRDTLKPWRYKTCYRIYRLTGGRSGPARIWCTEYWSCTG
jgi:hypothetical protein